MKIIKSPLNWVGNKYKYIDKINELVKGEKYDNIIDVFMGSENIILNIDAEANWYIGNDKNKLVPMLYNTINEISDVYVKHDFYEILSRWNEFKDKQDYYNFRDYWNKKYLNDKFDKDFIYETVMLLKMCSNSMVRFNPKEGYFNQGFRGLSQNKIDNGLGFFTKTMIDQSIDRLNELTRRFSERYSTFHNKDFMELELINGENNLLIFDPPYILRTDMYDTDFSKEHDKYLLDILRNTKSNFIYFNYLTSGDEVNIKLKEFIGGRDYKVIHINNKSLSGQGRKTDVKEVEEVIITNL